MRSMSRPVACAGALALAGLALAACGLTGQAGSGSPASAAAMSTAQRERASYSYRRVFTTNKVTVTIDATKRTADGGPYGTWDVTSHAVARRPKGGPITWDYKVIAQIPKGKTGTYHGGGVMLAGGKRSSYTLAGKAAVRDLATQPALWFGVNQQANAVRLSPAGYRGTTLFAGPTGSLWKLQLVKSGTPVAGAATEQTRTP
jgi:hypothetical protein